MLYDAIEFRAAEVRDAAGVAARPGAVLVQGGHIVAAGGSAEIDRAGRDLPVSDWPIVELPDRLLLPCMVNAHVHLDLTALGPQPYPGGFVQWVRGVVTSAPRDEPALRAAVGQGVAMSWAAGVGYAGDIARMAASVNALRNSSMAGVSFLECFGIGVRAGEVASVLERNCRSVLGPELAEPKEASSDWIGGIQPHAPYSTGLPVYDAAAHLAGAHGWRVSTHLAETPEEVEFVRDASGPFADLLRELDKWDGSIKPTGLHPVDYLLPVLRRANWLLAHCNYIEDRHVAMLKDAKASVAYCPIASEYFGHQDHRYREMVAAGVNVCLGTDSILCQPADEAQPLGVLPQMRRLFLRDGTDPNLLLRMATIHGARALGLPDLCATLQPGTPARVMAVRIDPDSDMDALTQVLQSNAPAELIYPRGDEA